MKRDKGSHSHGNRSFEAEKGVVKVDHASLSGLKAQQEVLETEDVGVNGCCRVWCCKAKPVELHSHRIKPFRGRKRVSEHGGVGGQVVDGVGVEQVEAEGGVLQAGHEGVVKEGPRGIVEGLQLACDVEKRARISGAIVNNGLE